MNEATKYHFATRQREQMASVEYLEMIIFFNPDKQTLYT